MIHAVIIWQASRRLLPHSLTSVRDLDIIFMACFSLIECTMQRPQVNARDDQDIDVGASRHVQAVADRTSYVIDSKCRAFAHPLCDLR